MSSTTNITWPTIGGPLPSPPTHTQGPDSTVVIQRYFTIHCACGHSATKKITGVVLKPSQSCWVGCDQCGQIMTEFYNHAGHYRIYAQGIENPYTLKKVGA